MPFSPPLVAIMSVAVGPSGDNMVYLDRLDQFLLHSTCPDALKKFDDTFALADMARTLQDHQLFFLFGCGSNQHNQLLLHSDAGDLVEGEDAHQIKEIVLCSDKPTTTDCARKIFAGGGHSGLVTQSGRLFLFGWNETGQLGTCENKQEEQAPLPVASELKGFHIEDASLGHSHTLVIEKDTARLYAFGDNSRGQVLGEPCIDKVTQPTTPRLLQDDQVSCVATGLFHSAVVTYKGELVTFGCDRFGQSLESGRWKPRDESRVAQVACGRHHTVALDSQGRIWTFGDNKYGQLGREGKRDNIPALVQTPAGLSFFNVESGWSHTVALAKDEQGAVVVFGWGRNDKGQLGTGNAEPVLQPTRLYSTLETVVSVACGSEFTVVVDKNDSLWACGWNEHGNLGTGTAQESSFELGRITGGAPIVKTPGNSKESRLCVAAGGAHVLAIKV
jgi:alpha-tubulin suppressor-like RCC1 family protein